MKTSKLLTAISAVAISVGASQVNAQEVQTGIFKVAKGASQKIDRFGVCKVIKNAGANPIMVPAGTAQQWSTGKSAFLTNIANIPGVTVDSCDIPLKLVDCSVLDPYNGSTIQIRNFGVNFETGGMRSWKVFEQAEYDSPVIPTTCRDIKNASNKAAIRNTMNANMSAIAGAGVKTCVPPSGAVWNPTTYRHAIKGVQSDVLMDFSGQGRGWLDGIQAHLRPTHGGGMSHYGTHVYQAVFGNTANATISREANGTLFEYFDSMTCQTAAETQCAVPFIEGNGDNPSVDVMWMLKSC